MAARRGRSRGVDNHERRARKELFDKQCYYRRHHIVIQNGVWIRTYKLFTMEECVFWFERGMKVPLDLVPPEFWRDNETGLYNFGEESLGEDF